MSQTRQQFDVSYEVQGIVPGRMVTLDDAQHAYYGTDHLCAWARKHERNWPYPYVLAYLIDGQWLFNEDDALAHIVYLWEVVYADRQELGMPTWWQWLVEHESDHWVHSRMLEQLADIERRQIAYEEEEQSHRDCPSLPTSKVEQGVS